MVMRMIMSLGVIVRLGVVMGFGMVVPVMAVIVPVIVRVPVIMAVMVVAMVVPAGAVVVRGALRPEGARDRARGAALPAHQLGIGRGGRDVEHVGGDLGGDVVAAELPGQARQPGRVYSRLEIGQEIWQGRLPEGSNVVDVHMANLRAKLRDMEGYGLLRTVRGVGYALRG